VIGLAMLLGGLGLWLMSGEIRTLALIGAFLVPLAGSSTETLIPAIAGDRVPKNLRSRALGLINTAGDLGATIGPFAALGALYLNWISLGGIYKIGGILFGIVALLALSPSTSAPPPASLQDAMQGTFGGGAARGGGMLAQFAELHAKIIV